MTGAMLRLTPPMTGAMLRLTPPHAIMAGVWGPLVLLAVALANELCHAQLRTTPARKPLPHLPAVPDTAFSCADYGAGYYADMEANCQVYHMCDTLGRQYSYLCPNMTLFNQRFMVCDHWNYVNCTNSGKYYKLNTRMAGGGKKLPRAARLVEMEIGNEIRKNKIKKLNAVKSEKMKKIKDKITNSMIKDKTTHINSSKAKNVTTIPTNVNRKSSLLIPFKSTSPSPMPQTFRRPTTPPTFPKKITSSHRSKITPTSVTLPTKNKSSLRPTTPPTALTVPNKSSLRPTTPPTALTVPSKSSLRPTTPPTALTVPKENMLKTSDEHIATPVQKNNLKDNNNISFVNEKITGIIGHSKNTNVTESFPLFEMLPGMVARGSRPGFGFGFTNRVQQPPKRVSPDQFHLNPLFWELSRQILIPKPRFGQRTTTRVEGETIESKFENDQKEIQPIIENEITRVMVKPISINPRSPTKTFVFPRLKIKAPDTRSQFLRVITTNPIIRGHGPDQETITELKAKQNGNRKHSKITNNSSIRTNIDSKQAFFIPNTRHASPTNFHGKINSSQPSPPARSRNTVGQSQHMTMMFEKPSVAGSGVKGSSQNTACAKCHPAFLSPGRCVPCVRIR